MTESFQQQTPVLPQQPQGYPPQKETAPGAVASLVCGIIGVAIGCTGLILGIIAIVQQKKAKALILQYPSRYEGNGMCTAGLVLGIIGICGGAFWAIYLVFVLIFTASVSAL